MAGALNPHRFNYFGFGSNLLKERLKLMNPSAEFIGIGHVTGYRVAFFGDFSRWHGAAATMVPSNSTDGVVWGCVWSLDESHSASLDEQEKGYDRIIIKVHSGEGSLTCRTYQKPMPIVETLPSPHYMHVLISGAIEHDFPEEYINKLKNIPTNKYNGPVKISLKILDHFQPNIDNNP